MTLPKKLLTCPIHLDISYYHYIGQKLTWHCCMCSNPENGRVDFVDGWLRKSNFITNDEMKFVNWPGPNANKKKPYSFLTNNALFLVYSWKFTLIDSTSILMNAFYNPNSTKQKFICLFNYLTFETFYLMGYITHIS